MPGGVRGLRRPTQPGCVAVEAAPRGFPDPAGPRTTAPVHPGKVLKRVEIFSWQGTLETDKANYRALARRAGRRCLEHEGRMPVRQPYPSALSFSALRSPGGIALPGPTEQLGR